MAPAGIVMALTGVAMAPQNRAFGMGVFLDPFVPILLAIAMFGLTIVTYAAFCVAQRVAR